MKKWIALALALALCLTLLPMNVLAAEELSGSCGANVTWSLENGVLTISGTGPMQDYLSIFTPPWSAYTGEITKVVIGSGVTSIGWNSFNNCTNLTCVELPEGLKTVTGFANCVSLTSIELPDGVESVDGFGGCTGLTAIELPDSVESIGGYAFSDCTNLTSVKLSKSLKSIGGFAFGGCENLAGIVIPDGVESIGNYAFKDCIRLVSVELPDSLESIGNYAFSECYSLADIQIPGGLTSIGDHVFYYCLGLKSAVISDGVESIGNSMFIGCSGLLNVTIPASVNTIESYAFSGCRMLYDVYYGGSEEQWAGIAISAGNDALYTATVHFNSTGPKEGEIPSYFVIEDGVLVEYRGPGGDVVVPDGVTAIGNEAFLNCKSLRSVKLPVGVKSIGYGAFWGCTGLTSIELPEGLESIGNSAFWNCTGLTSIELPDSVESVSGFTHCTNLVSVKFSKNLKSIGDSAFMGCESLTGVVLPSGLESIGFSAFSVCTSLTDIVIPDGITNIDGGTFSGCVSLTNVTIPVSVNTIGTRAFLGCDALSDVYYGGTMEQWFRIEIINWEGSNEPLLTANLHFGDGESFDFESFVIANGVLIEYRGPGGDVVIPKGVKSIGEDAFWGCTGLTSVVVPDGVESIGESAFDGCSGLTGIELPESLKSIDSFAFRNCKSLTSVVLPDGIERLSSYMFSRCSGLLNVTIPASVSIIEYYAFDECNALSDVYYGGSREQWYDIRILASNYPLNRATIHYNRKAFSDVPADEYYANAVVWAVNKGITTGTDPGVFSPEEACTRAQIVTFLWRAFGKPEPVSAISQFHDVTDPNEYYYKAVLWAVEQGITTGTDPGVFSPEEVCTRSQIVTFLWRAFGKPAPASSVSQFGDVKDANEYYYNAVLWAVEQGITTGTDPGVFSPEEDCTRAQIVTFLYRALA